MVIFEFIVGLLAPHNCESCGREGSLLCDWCAPDAFEQVPSRCYVCYKFTIDSATCLGCLKKSKPTHLWVVAQYEGLTKELVRKLKYARARNAHKILAQQLSYILPDIDKEVIVSHIPTATSRRRQRGYDQSELVAKRLAKLKKLKHETLLSRVGQTRQVGSSKKQRVNQLVGAFRANKRTYGVKSVLLVDDLLTTGATMEAATKTLKDAGVKKVYGCVFAQKQ